MRKVKAPALRVGLAITLAGLLAGCVMARYQTETPRSATEQLLLAKAVENAVAALELPELGGKKVALESAALADGDMPYLLAALRDRLGAAGATVVPRDAADLVFELRAGSVGTVSRAGSFGIPELPVPGGLVTPSIPFFATRKQRAYVELRVATYRPDGTWVQTTGPVLERASFEVYQAFFLSIRRNDIYPGEGFAVGLD